MAGIGLPDARAQAVYAGVCQLTLEVTYQPTEIDIGGSGPCATGDAGTALIEGTIDGSALALTPTTCYAGVWQSDNGSFTINEYDSFDGANGAELTIVVIAGVAYLTMVSVEDQFVGTGEFVQQPTDTAACLPDEVVGTATWCGFFEFVATGPLPTTPPR